MKPIQWLFIGGPHHGTTMWIHQGSFVRMPGSGEEQLLYQGENYLHSNRLYRIGRFNPTPSQSAEVGTLINKRNLKPIAGD
jgi:hypothetical protein